MHVPARPNPPDTAAAPPRRRAPRHAEIDPAVARANVRHAGGVMIVAVALMALFNSAGLASYARDLPAGWFADTAVLAADRWHALMVALGPAELRPAFAEALDWVRGRSW